MALCQSFNAILEEELTDRKHHYIMDVSNAVNQQHNFTLANVMNEDGKAVFWREVDLVLKKFDYQEVSLIPRKFSASQVQPQAYRSNTSYSQGNRVCVQPRETHSLHQMTNAHFKSKNGSNDKKDRKDN